MDLQSVFSKSIWPAPLFEWPPASAPGPLVPFLVLTLLRTATSPPPFSQLLCSDRLGESPDPTFEFGS